MDPPVQEIFRHRDHDVDRFERVGNQVFGFVRNWGVAIFAMGLAGVPLALLLPVNDAVFAVYAASTFFVAVYFSYRHAMRLRHDRITIARGGFELVRWPKPPLVVPWTQVRRIHDPTDYTDDDPSPEPLKFDTAQGHFQLSPDHWPLAGIMRAIERHHRIDKNARS